MKRGIRVILSSDFQSTFTDLVNQCTLYSIETLDPDNTVIYTPTVRFIRKLLPFNYKVLSIYKAKLNYDVKNWILILNHCTRKTFDKFYKYLKRFNIVIIAVRITVDPQLFDYVLEDKSNLPPNKFIRNLYDKLAESEFGGNSDPFLYKSKLRKKKPSLLRKQIIPKSNK